MSTTPTPSESSGQSIYYDAVVMHFLHKREAAMEGQGDSFDPKGENGSSSQDGRVNYLLYLHSLQLPELRTA